MKKSNIIVFMTDQQRGDTILENSTVLTPFVDKFRNESITFTNAYCPSPHCSPSRATFFSGLYPSEHGVWNNVNVNNALSRGLYDNVRLFSEDLKDAGYKLYFAGKWHVSSEKGPDSYGFEMMSTIKTKYSQYKKYDNIPYTDEWNDFKDKNRLFDSEDEEKSDGRIIREGYNKYFHYGNNEHPFNDEAVTHSALDKLDSLNDNDGPFMMYVGNSGTHNPYKVPQRFLDMYNIDDIKLPESFFDNMDDKPALYRRTQDRFAQLTQQEQRECIRHYYAFCTYEDWLFGQLLNKVEEKGLMDNTIILYLSDHGDYVGSHGLWTKGLPCFKEAYNICSMIGGGPVKNKGKVEDVFISLADYAPTFLEIAGVKTTRHFAGRSLVPFIENREISNWRTELFTQSNGNELYGIQRAVFNKEWKYVYNGFDYDELYNLKEDPNEINNLLNGVRNVKNSKYSSIVKEMCKKIWNFSYENKDNCVNQCITTALAPYGPEIIFNIKD